jgi:hypothetical protein
MSEFDIQIPSVSLKKETLMEPKKVVIASIPSITDLPYFNIVNFNEIRKINKSELDIAIREINGIDYPILGVPNGSIMIPNALADSLLNPNIPATQKRGLSYKTPLNTNEVYLYDKVKLLLDNLNNQNEVINSQAKLINCPVVDLYSLYKKITKNDLISDDGIKVTQQNFFSSDGIFPSAFGQAIIANEYIKTINSFYKTNIPLIQTAYYLNK